MQFLFIISHDDAFAPTETLFADIAAWTAEAEKRGMRLARMTKPRLTTGVLP